MIFAAFS